jgi:hypothetical protein
LSKANAKNQQVAFDATKSSTFKKIDGATWKISYGDGSGASGDVGTDVIDLGGLKIQGQAVELAKQLSAQFQQVCRRRSKTVLEKLLTEARRVTAADFLVSHSAPSTPSRLSRRRPQSTMLSRKRMFLNLCSPLTSEAGAIRTRLIKAR